jgi:hypothetical protein
MRVHWFFHSKNEYKPSVAVRSGAVPQEILLVIFIFCGREKNFAFDLHFNGPFSNKYFLRKKLYVDTTGINLYLLKKKLLEGFVLNF